MKTNLFIGIDNGKAGATAIIDENRSIVDVFKYDPKDTMYFYKKLKPYVEQADSLFAYIEEPIVVYGLAHQTAPFETIGRHKMMLEILGISYACGSPRETSPNNWKKHLNLLDAAKEISKADKARLSELRAQKKSLEAQALSKGYKLKSRTKEYLGEAEKNFQLEYKLCTSEMDKIKKGRKTGIKQLSVDTCLTLFPDAGKYIKKVTSRSESWDDDMAEALLLAECGRILNAKN